MSVIAETAEIRGGFTMADLDRLAQVAARRHGGATDYADRYDAAWFGAVTELYTTDEPTERDLLFAAVRAVQAAVTERNQAQGRSHRHGYEYGSAPAFAKFWAGDSLVVQSHEHGIVERTALEQALATLSGEQYEALAAAAVCDTLPAAAEALGIAYGTFLNRYYAAREQVRALWHEGETLRRERASEDACKSGHDRATHTRTKPDGKRYCQECQRLAKARRRARGAA